MSTTEMSRHTKAQQASLKFAKLMEAATAALEANESTQHCASNAASLWDALIEHHEEMPHLAAAAAQAKQDCMTADKDALAELIARAAIAWGNHIAAVLRGRDCDLLIHIAEHQRQIAVWAEELDPEQPVYDYAAEIFWITDKPDNIDERIRDQYHPKSARIERLQWALRLQHASHNVGMMQVQTGDGPRKAPAVVMVESEARQRLADALTPNAEVAVKLDPEAWDWLNQH